MDLNPTCVQWIVTTCKRVWLGSNRCFLASDSKEWDDYNLQKWNHHNTLTCVMLLSEESNRWSKQTGSTGDTNKKKMNVGETWSVFCLFVCFFLIERVFRKFVNGRCIMTGLHAQSTGQECGAGTQPANRELPLPLQQQHCGFSSSHVRESRVGRVQGCILVVMTDTCHMLGWRLFELLDVAVRWIFFFFLFFKLSNRFVWRGSTVF